MHLRRRLRVILHVTFFGVQLLTAIPTAVLAVFAIVTAWYARLAFRKQSQEVAAIEQQVKDEQEVTRQQAELLKVQIAQLEVLREQVDDQRKASAAQAEVLELQAHELRESLDQRKTAADQQRRRAQASRVFLADERVPGREGESLPYVVVTVVNGSDQAIYQAELLWPPDPDPCDDEPNPEPLGVVLPGDRVQTSRGFAIHTYIGVTFAVLRFTDAAGVRWMRSPDGELTEQA